MRRGLDVATAFPCAPIPLLGAASLRVTHSSVWRWTKSATIRYASAASVGWCLLNLPLIVEFRARPTMPYVNNYVRLEFPNAPLMAADLCHTRSDLVREMQGILIDRGEDGSVRQVVVAAMQ
jgi:hypothetical protein